jgi:Fe-S cluster assembly protein SufD
MLEPQLQEILSRDDALALWRKKYWDRFRDLGSLELKHEAFQYLSLQNLTLPKSARKVSDLKIRPSKHPFNLVFIDGFFSREHSRLPEEAICLPLDEAMSSYPVFLQNRMMRTLKEEGDPFAALNGAFQGLGAFFYLPPKIQLTSPLHVEHIFTGSDMATPRLVIYLGKHANLELIQHWHTEEEESHFANAHVDAALDEGAALSFKNIQKKAPKTHLFHSLRASLKRDSNLKVRLYSQGALISRHSIKVQLLEENGQVLLQGLSDLAKQNNHHVHATVEHLAPHARSRQHFKALLNDQSRASFEGKIYVHSSAQKTESYQLNNNLLLSPESAAYAKPNLEIFADDVKASHGATVSKLDEESLFYLRSRGLSKEEAKLSLIQSFIQELADCLP